MRAPAPLELDFVRRRSPWPGVLVALVGLVLVVDAGSSYQRLAGEAEDLTQRRMGVAARGQRAEPMSEHTQREVQAARKLLVELALPWERLFRTIEGALDKDTALLAITPDPAKQTLQLSGEARSYGAILGFVERLERGDTLTRVHLLSHEVREDAPERPTQFTLSAQWRAAR